MAARKPSPRVIDSSHLMKPRLVRWPRHLRDVLTAYLGWRAQSPEDARRGSATPERPLTPAEHHRAYAADAQRRIDGLLKRLLKGEDPRRVFRLGAQGRGRPPTHERNQAMAHEVARLIEQHAMTPDRAMQCVVTKFKVKPRTVKSACAHAGRVDVAQYIANLKTNKLL
jgi:hypothetical protein